MMAPTPGIEPSHSASGYGQPLFLPLFLAKRVNSLSGAALVEGSTFGSDLRKTGMAFLSAEQLDALRVDELIFHVVGPQETDLVLMDEVITGNGGTEETHRQFFLDRLKSTNGGNLFDFRGASVVRTALEAIEANPNAFVHRSRELAQAFHNGHHGNTSKGVFLLLRLSAQIARSAQIERFYGIVKYDHESVLSYVMQTAGGRVRANLSELTDTFVRSREALQKSSIIKLTRGGGELCVRDRSNLRDISGYFRAFLGVERRNSPTSLTKHIVEAAKQAALRNTDSLGPEVIKNLNRRVWQTVQNQDGYDPENPEPFISSLFGALPQDAPFRRDFAREMERRRIHTESFDFAKSAVQRPRRRRLITEEGIQILFNQEDESLVQQRQQSGKTVITITTSRIKVDDDYPEEPGGRGSAARQARG